jgi:hypothetical protein
MPKRFDALAAIRRLPSQIKRDLPALIVNREGELEDAYMHTDHIIGHVYPNETYRLGWDGMTGDPNADLPGLPKPIEPKSAVLAGRWDSKIDFVNGEANILGGNGRYTLPEDQCELVIPDVECTPEHLAFYGSRLVKVGEPISFQANAPLPVTRVSVGKTYATNFLMDSIQGGGEFLELHDRPHFHMPLDADSDGHLIIGTKVTDAQRKISAFRIPFGFGVLMPPWVIHADSHLVGHFLVVYSVTNVFSTVTIRKSNGELARITIS